ncbi:MAG: methyl-accepting chemotaxis protein [Spirochaetes bacterium]|nr:methyl-accepting chemotaxis protein [Spirochaetota bacterium]MBU1079343.1 methyl-accepting chemotaxis protein [Spirochaetota bacterium]
MDAIATGADAGESRRMDELESNYGDAIDNFVVGYHKGLVLSSVTRHSLEILDDSMSHIEAGLSTVVTAFEEIKATSSSTASNAERIDSMMADVLGGNDGIEAGISARMEDVERGVSVAKDLGGMFAGLKAKTSGVAGITGAIQDVSDRTNILAINASIEAARAGSVGKGFRIIANEVRTLAGQTSDFAKQIDASIGELSSAVGDIAGRMDEFVELFTRFRESFAEVRASSGENAESVRQAGQLLAQISGAIKEETQALGDGLHSLESISASAKDTHAVFGALRSSHEFLDTLLDRKA